MKCLSPLHLGFAAVALAAGLLLSAGQGGASTLIGDDVGLIISNDGRVQSTRSGTVGLGTDFTIGTVTFDLAAGPDNNRLVITGPLGGTSAGLAAFSAGPAR